MRSSFLACVAAVAFALLLLVPADASARSPLSQPSPSAPGALVTDAVPLPAGSTVSSLSAGTGVSVVLTLAYSDPTGLGNLLVQLQDPESAEYRHFLTPAEFNAVYDPTAGAVAAARAALVAAGGRDVSVAPNRATVTAVLPARSVDSLFDVELTVFGHDGAVPIYTAVGTPTLPTSLRGLVTGVDGLTDADNPYLWLSTGSTPLHDVTAARSPGEFVLNESTQWLIGSDFTQAYGATSLFPGGSIGITARYPTDVAVATLLASAYNTSTGQNLPPFDPNVIDTYLNNSSNPAWPHSPLTGVPVTVDGVTPPAPGFFGIYNDSTAFEFENSLDLEMAGSLAPGAPLYNFYFAGSLTTGTDLSTVGQLADAFAADLGTALNYPYPSGVRLGVATGSFGLPDLNDSAWNSDLVEAAATGVTVISASGDQGNAPASDTGRGPDGQWPTWPATAAFATSGTMSIGGVSLTLAGEPTTVYNGNSLNVTYDSNISGISGMTTWYDNEGPANSGTWAGSEGGLSTVISEPSWQFHSAAQPAIAEAGIAQGASFLGRAGPDLAFPANNTIAYVTSDDQGNLYFGVFGGTSIAAPVFAGFLADEAAVLNTSFGFLDPILYRMGGYYVANPGPTDPFFDVTTGANYVFSAGPGWDATTGWGGLAAAPFYTALQNATVTGYQYTGPTPGLPATTSSGSSFPLTAILVIVGLSVAAAVALVIAFGRPRQPRSSAGPAWGPGAPTAPAGVWAGPPGAPPPPPGAVPPPHPSTATFLCPYCGAPRPAEPVRCPRCGQL